MTQLSNIHFFLIFISIFFVFKNRDKDKSFFILFLVIFLYFINDSLRLLASNVYTDISIFVIKDLVLLLATISIINTKLIKNFISLSKKNKNLIACILIYLLINFIIINKKILFFAGFYDLFFLFIVVIYLYELKIKIENLSNIFTFLLAIFVFLFLFQMVDLKFYANLFFNNVESGLINSIFELKSYNPQIVDNTEVFIQQNTSIFNNAGRLNHFLVPFFGILIFLYLNNKKKIFIIYLLITYLLIIINSSRYTLILSSLPIIFLLYHNYRNLIFSKNFKILSLILLITYLVTVLFYNSFHYNKLSRKIQSNEILLIIYHNFYEPILSSFDKKRDNTASSITGRLKIISNESKGYFISEDKINFTKIIFGNGIGTHSLTTKHIDKNNKYLLENSFLILIYEYGLIGFLILLFIYYKFSLLILNQIKNIDYLILTKCLFTYPLLLFLTGYQFYRDFAFQFFFFVLIGLIINFSINNKNHLENFSK